MSVQAASVQVLQILDKVSTKQSVSKVSQQMNIDNDVFLSWGGFSMKQIESVFLPDSINRMIEGSDQKRKSTVNISITRLFSSNLKNTTIKYSFFNDTVFGPGMVASTETGICYLGFSSDVSHTTDTKLFQDMKKRYQYAASFQNETTKEHLKVIDYLCFEDNSKQIDLNLHILGTDFQFQVWNELLCIPKNQLSTYGKVAANIKKPQASRAVGSAIGKNPVSFFIPCHKIINANGEIGQYMWGSNIKRAIICWEALH
ncbi:hypothetical protein QEN19_003386 [Hanseniaspora menglaensis]